MKWCNLFHKNKFVSNIPFAIYVSMIQNYILELIKSGPRRYHWETPTIIFFLTQVYNYRMTESNSFRTPARTTKFASSAHVLSETRLLHNKFTGNTNQCCSFNFSAICFFYFQASWINCYIYVSRWILENVAKGEDILKFVFSLGDHDLNSLFLNGWL